MFRLLVFGTVAASVIAAMAAPAAAQRGRERMVSPPNALPPVPVLPSYNAPVNPSYGGYAGPVYNGYNGSFQRQGRFWIPPSYDQFGNVIPGYWR